MKTIKVKCIESVICVGLALATTSAFAQTYIMADVDLSYTTSAGAINDSGYVGGATFGGDASLASYSNVGLGIAGRIVDSRTIPYLESKINDLNKGALGVGGRTIGFDPTIATLFTYDQRTIAIGVLPGDNGSEALAVNDAGWVVGYSYRGGLNVRETAFVWVPQAGDISRPGTMYALSCSQGNARAKSINRDGWIGGYCGNKPYIWLAYSPSYGRVANDVSLYEYDITSWLPAQIDVGLGLVGRASVEFVRCEVNSLANSYAFSVYCATEPLGISFVSTPTRPALTQVPQLGLYFGQSSQVHIHAINDEGCAVGQAGLPGPFYSAAVKYCDGRLINLNTDLFVPSDDYLYSAEDINNHGLILATAFSRFWRRYGPVVLTPR